MTDRFTYSTAQRLQFTRAATANRELINHIIGSDLEDEQNRATYRPLRTKTYAGQPAHWNKIEINPSEGNMRPSVSCQAIEPCLERYRGSLNRRCSVDRRNMLPYASYGECPYTGYGLRR